MNISIRVQLGKIKKTITEALNKNGKANFLLFDLETTGVKDPEITEFGYMVVTATKDENGGVKLEFPSRGDKKMSTKLFYPSKQIEPKAVVVTGLVRKEDLNDVKYIKSVKEAYESDEKAFDVKALKPLTPEIGSYTPDILDKLLGYYEIDLLAGHNIYKYDYKTVLNSTYGNYVKEDRFFDTMLFQTMFEGVNTKKPKNLTAMTKDVMGDTDLFDKLSANREVHDALSDLEMNAVLFEKQTMRMFSDTVLGNMEPTIEKNNNRPYKSGDILYLTTNMSRNTTLRNKEIVKYCAETGVDTVVIADDSFSNVLLDEKEFVAGGIKMIRALRVVNENMEKIDLIIPNTTAYRMVIAAIQGGETTSEVIEILRKEAGILKMPADKMDSPSFLDISEKKSAMYLSSIVNNEPINSQSVDLIMAEDDNNSLRTGDFTSDTKQAFLKEKLKSFEEVDYKFFPKMGLSLFPPLAMFDETVKKEPDTMNGYVDALLDFRKRNCNRKTKNDEKYQKRLDEEIEVLRATGNPDFIKYFFLMAYNKNLIEKAINRPEVVNDKKYYENGKIPAYGPGRGSAAGSLLAYDLEITDVDPVEHGLLFERFIDPSRAEMPDIDVDVMNRQTVFSLLKSHYEMEMPKFIDYTKAPYDIYSKEFIERFIKPSPTFVLNVTNKSITKTTSILSNLVRTMNLPKFVADEVANLNKFNKGEVDKKETVNEVIGMMSEKVQDAIYQALSYDDLAMLNDYINVGGEKNGVFTNFGTHAGGMLFSPYHAQTLTPIRDNRTEFDKNDIESTGLIKMDYLAINTVSAIYEAMQEVVALGGKTFIVGETNMDDPKLMTAIARGYTSRTFQLEGVVMKKFLQQLAPLKFEDILSVVALNRPGPKDSFPEFVSMAQSDRRKKYGLPFIPLADFKKMDKDKLRVQLVKVMSRDYDPIQLEDDFVLENIYTTAPYDQTKEFEKEMNEIYESIEDKDPAYTQIIKEYKVTSKAGFKDAMIDAQNKIKTHPAYAKIMDPTYGTMIYQEQIMQLSILMAGYTKSESSSLRKAIGKKIAELMAKHMEKITEKILSSENPLSASQTALMLYKVKKFGEYAFNKSHAVSYTVISIMSQYYKEYYPAIGYAALLKDTPDDRQDAIKKEIFERGISIGLQNIGGELSMSPRADVKGNTIMLPLNMIKAFGEVELAKLIGIKENNPFETLEEMILSYQAFPAVPVKRMAEYGMLNGFKNQSAYSQGQWLDLVEQEKEPNGFNLTKLFEGKFKKVIDLYEADLKQQLKGRKLPDDVIKTYTSKAVFSNMVIVEQMFKQLVATSGVEGLQSNKDYLKKIGALEKEMVKASISQPTIAGVIAKIEAGDVEFYKTGKAEAGYKIFLEVGKALREKYAPQIRSIVESVGAETKGFPKATPEKERASVAKIKTKVTELVRIKEDAKMEKLPKIKSYSDLPSIKDIPNFIKEAEEAGFRIYIPKGAKEVRTLVTYEYIPKMMARNPEERNQAYYFQKVLEDGMSDGEKKGTAVAILIMNPVLEDECVSMVEDDRKQRVVKFMEFCDKYIAGQCVVVLPEFKKDSMVEKVLREKMPKGFDTDKGVEFMKFTKNGEKETIVFKTNKLEQNLFARKIKDYILKANEKSGDISSTPRP